MKKIIPIIALFGLLVCVSCTHSGEPRIIHNAVKDYDGNQYDAVRIGRQTWMKTNLRTTHYADGTPISAGLGEDVQAPAYCEIPGVDSASYGLLTTGMPQCIMPAIRETKEYAQRGGMCPLYMNGASWCQMLPPITTGNIPMLRPALWLLRWDGIIIHPSTWTPFIMRMILWL